jgi:hypothetical protein
LSSGIKRFFANMALSVAPLLKAYAERIGLRAADFGAHSLRADFLTSAPRLRA